jgi:hypothetical protein
MSPKGRPEGESLRSQHEGSSGNLPATAGAAVPGDVDAPDAVAAAVARWLLEGPAQLGEGREAGGVAGIVDADGSAAYVYPEITGYYLQWLAWRAARYGDDPALARRAQSAQRWIGAWLAASSPPLTRVHLRVAGNDWRNDAVFLFDVAMVLRGLGAAARWRLVEPSPAIVAGVCAELDRLVDGDGHFKACASHRGDALPARWSTRSGAFLAKAAAGILGAAEALDTIPARLLDAASRTYDESLRLLVACPHAETHPLLYACEGVLSMPADPRLAAVLPSITAQFDALLAQVRRFGRVPEFLHSGSGDPGARRMDIVAQTLRVGALLAAHRPQNPPDRAGLERLRRSLIEHIAPAGTLPFAAGVAPPRYNVWAAMFADQALAMAGSDDAARLIGLDGPLLV